MDRKGIGKRLEEARKKKGLSRRAVGRMAELHRDTVKNIETGAHAGLITNIEKIASVVGVKI